MGKETNPKKPHDALSIKLGKRIRDLRQSKNMRILDLANMTGLTSSMISQVERSGISPSIETLKKIGNALAVPVGYFFEEDNEENQPIDTSTDSARAGIASDPQIIRGMQIMEISPVVHEHQRKVLSPGKGVQFYLLNPNLDGPIEFIYNIYEAGSGTGLGLYSHPGTECGLILEGELVVRILDKIYRLQKGDSITFDSSQPHSKVNEGEVRCTCIWANSPPYF